MVKVRVRVRARPSVACTRGTTTAKEGAPVHLRVGYSCTSVRVRVMVTVRFKV